MLLNISVFVRETEKVGEMEIYVERERVKKDNVKEREREREREYERVKK